LLVIAATLAIGLALGIAAAAVVGLIAVGVAVAVILALAVFVVIVALIVDRLRSAEDCRLVRRAVLRDTCEGGCPNGQVCLTTATRPYGPGFLGLRPQAAACACRPTVSFGGPGGGAPGENG
jgi:hypothetical protein